LILATKAKRRATGSSCYEHERTHRPKQLAFSDQSVAMGGLDVRHDLFHCLHCKRACRSVSAENIDIVANEADGADSGVIPASAFAFGFDEN